MSLYLLNIFLNKKFSKLLSQSITVGLTEFSRHDFIRLVSTDDNLKYLIHSGINP